tara:strand:- start:107 stop:490 length:384 start_codon:yes stop_codon:yes gene_type:complete
MSALHSFLTDRAAAGASEVSAARDSGSGQGEDELATAGEDVGGGDQEDGQAEPDGLVQDHGEGPGAHPQPHPEVPRDEGGAAGGELAHPDPALSGRYGWRDEGGDEGKAECFPRRRGSRDCLSASSA